MTAFDLIIFDCDGILVDSEPISNRVFRDMLRELGAGATLDDMYERFLGHSMAHCLGLAREGARTRRPRRFRGPLLGADRRRPRGGAAAGARIEAVLDAMVVPRCAGRLSLGRGADGRRAGAHGGGGGHTRWGDGGESGGMTVFGYAASTPAHRLGEAGASVVFSRMSELPGLLSAPPPPPSGRS